MEPANWQAARICTQQERDVAMSEVTITIKDVVDGDAMGVIFDYEIVDDNEHSLAVYVADALASHAIKILEGDFAELTEDKVH